MIDTPTSLASVEAYLSYVKNVEDCGGCYSKSITVEQKHWLAVAKLALANHIAPARFVTAQFLSLDPTRRVTLTPRMLHTPKKIAVERAIAHAPSPCDYGKMVQSLMDKARSVAIRRECSVDEVLKDPEQMFPPWFRLAYSEHSDKAMAEIYMDAANEELEMLENYDLKKFLMKEGRYDGRFTNSGDKRKYL